MRISTSASERLAMASFQHTCLRVIRTGLICTCCLVYITLGISTLAFAFHGQQMSDHVEEAVDYGAFSSGTEGTLLPKSALSEFEASFPSSLLSLSQERTRTELQTLKKRRLFEGSENPQDGVKFAPPPNAEAKQNNAAMPAHNHPIDPLLHHNNHQISQDIAFDRVITDNSPLSLAASNESGDTKPYKLMMYRHSFTSPLSYDAYQEVWDWDINGAAVPTKTNLILVPAIAGLTGSLWHNYPLKTTNFEIFFSFFVGRIGRAGNQPVGVTSLPEGFVFWLSLESGSESQALLRQAEKQDTNAPGQFLGYKTNPNALGIYFLTHDKDGKYNPSITAIYNDGSRHISRVEDVIGPSTTYYNFYSTTPTQLHLFKVSASPRGVQGLIQTPDESWTTCFHLKELKFSAAGAFIGLTAASAPLSAAPSTVLDVVAVNSLFSYNLDMSQTGEDNEDIRQALGDNDISGLLRSSYTFRDFYQLSEAFRQLVRIVYKQVTDQAGREGQILRTSRSVLARLQHLENDVTELRRGVSVLAGSKSSEAFDVVSGQISGLRALLHNQAEKHFNSVSQLEEKIKDDLQADLTKQHLSVLSDQEQFIKGAIANRDVTTTVLMIIICFSIALFALFVGKRFRDMEKSHYL